MNPLYLRLAFAFLLTLAAPRAAWSAAPGNAGAGHGGALGRGGGSMGALNPAGPMRPFAPGAPNGRLFGDGGRLDAEGRFDRDGGHDFAHGFRRGEHRFAYPLCYAYPSCPSVLEPCIWRGGSWIAEPVVTDDGSEVAEQFWVPPGCY